MSSMIKCGTCGANYSSKAFFACPTCAEDDKGRVPLISSDMPLPTRSKPTSTAPPDLATQTMQQKLLAASLATANYVRVIALIVLYCVFSSAITYCAVAIAVFTSSSSSPFEHLGYALLIAFGVTAVIALITGRLLGSAIRDAMINRRTASSSR